MWIGKGGGGNMSSWPHPREIKTKIKKNTVLVLVVFF